MPTAGFYAIESHAIRFGRDGEWYSDGEHITNRRIADLFSRCVRRAPDGGYLLQMGDERAPLEVEDTPYVVRQIEGEGESDLRVVLNDGSSEALDPRTLRSGEDHALYCRVKHGEFEARLLRPAHYALARFIEVDADGKFRLSLGGSHHPIDAR
jgi:uncharacterized protein